MKIKKGYRHGIPFFMLSAFLIGIAHIFLKNSGVQKETNKILNRMQMSPFLNFLWLFTSLF